MDLPDVRIDADDTHVVKATNENNSSWRKYFLFSAIVPTNISLECHSKLPVLLMNELFNFNEKESKVVFTTKPTYKVCLTYTITVKTIRTTISFLDIEAGVHLMNPSLISTG